MVLPLGQYYTSAGGAEGRDAMIPDHSRYVIVGAGIHGLSTAWQLAAELRRRGLGGGGDVLVLDKRGVGAGASGIACGVIRNNYFQPAMRELMAHSVAIWESDPQALAYHPVGYMQIAPEEMHGNVANVASEPDHNDIVEALMTLEDFFEGAYGKHHVRIARHHDVAFGDRQTRIHCRRSAQTGLTQKRKM